MTIAVFDTNLLIALLVFADRRYRPLFDAVATGRLIALASAPSLEKLRQVLAYPHFSLTPTDQAVALAKWRALAQLAPRRAVSIAPLPACADRDDQKFLELARDGGAD